MTTDIKINKKFKEFEQLAVHLKNQKLKSNPNLNLHKHINDMMNHIVVHCPRDALDKLEEISYLIKNGDYIAIEDFLKMNESKLYAAPSTQEMRNNTDSFIASSQKFFKVSVLTISSLYSLILIMFYYRKIQP